jgi:hypothetical protein
MKRWFFGWELFERWDCSPVEFVDYIKSGLSLYDEIGRQIIDIDTLPRRKVNIGKDLFDTPHFKPTNHKCTLEEKLNAASKGQEWEFDEYFTEQFHMEFMGYDFVSGTVPIVPCGANAKSFALPPDADEAAEFITKLKSFRFKHQDVIDFEKCKGLLIEKQNDSPFSSTSEKIAVSGSKVIRAIKQTPSQQDKQKSIEIAQEYIQGCDNSVPSIKEAVDLVINKQTKSLYKSNTIHNWIKNIFPPESRKPGRRTNKS